MAKRRISMKVAKEIPKKMREFHKALQAARDIDEIRDAQHGSGAASGSVRYQRIEIACDSPSAKRAIEQHFTKSIAEAMSHAR